MTAGDANPRATATAKILGMTPRPRTAMGAAVTKTSTTMMNTDALTRMEDWLGKAHRAVMTAFPTVYFGTETEEKYAAGQKLDAALYAHFYQGGISMEELLVVWREYYRSAIPF